MREEKPVADGAEIIQLDAYRRSYEAEEVIEEIIAEVSNDLFDRFGITVRADGILDTVDELDELEEIDDLDIEDMADLHTPMMRPKGELGPVRLPDDLEALDRQILRLNTMAAELIGVPALHQNYIRDRDSMIRIMRLLETLSPEQLAELCPDVAEVR